MLNANAISPQTPPSRWRKAYVTSCHGRKNATGAGVSAKYSITKRAAGRESATKIHATKRTVLTVISRRSAGGSSRYHRRNRSRGDSSFMGGNAQKRSG